MYRSICMIGNTRTCFIVLAREYRKSPALREEVKLCLGKTSNTNDYFNSGVLSEDSDRCKLFCPNVRGDSYTY